MANDRSRRERFEIVPASAARGDDDAKRAARRVAEVLGEIVGSSSTVDDARREIAFAFDVQPHSGDEERALIVAGARSLEGQIVLRVPREHALSGMNLAKAIASSPPDALAGERLVVDVEGRTTHVVLKLAESVASHVGSTRVLIANVDARSTERAKLERCLERLARLRELDAPKMIIDGDEKLIRRVHADLVAGGWDPEADPLPDPLRELCASVLRTRGRRR